MSLLAKATVAVLDPVVTVGEKLRVKSALAPGATVTGPAGRFFREKHIVAEDGTIVTTADCRSTTRFFFPELWIESEMSLVSVRIVSRKAKTPDGLKVPEAGSFRLMCGEAASARAPWAAAAIGLLHPSRTIAAVMNATRKKNISTSLFP